MTKVLAILALYLLSAKMDGQTLRLRFLDGKTGKQVTTFRPLVFAARHGDLKIRIEEGDYLVDLSSPETLQIQGYNKPIYSLCNKKKDQIWFISSKEIMAGGYVSDNICGKRGLSKKPGIATFYIRPTHWWERLD